MNSQRYSIPNKDKSQFMFNGKAVHSYYSTAWNYSKDSIIYYLFKIGKGYDFPPLEIQT